MNEFLDKVNEVLDYDLPVTPIEEFRNHEEWDSLSYLVLLAFFSDEYNVTITRSIFESFQTIEQIYNYLKSEGLDL